MLAVVELLVTLPPPEIMPPVLSCQGSLTACACWGARARPMAARAQRQWQGGRERQDGVLGYCER